MVDCRYSYGYRGRHLWLALLSRAYTLKLLC
jgi:hypothetical protein